jgi:hypothetical protein
MGDEGRQWQQRSRAEGELTTICIVSHMHSLFLNDKVHTFILIAAGNTASYCMTTPTLNMGQ